MYGLPKDADLSFLQNTEIQQVCIGVWEVILRFREEISITITTSFSCGKSDHEMVKYEDPRQAAGALVKLLDTKVSAVRGSEDGTLVLHFSNGEILKIYDNSKQFESYVIVDHGDFKIIV